MNESYGASTTANMAVNVNVVGKCSVTTNTLLFPDYDGSLPAQDSIVSSPAISVNCANNENYTISLGVGVGTYTQRVMKNAGNPNLNYNLYTDATLAHVWGDGSGATQTVAGVGNNNVQNITVNGKIPGGQTTITTNTLYADLIAVTVNY